MKEPARLGLSGSDSVTRLLMERVIEAPSKAVGPGSAVAGASVARRP